MENSGFRAGLGTIQTEYKDFRAMNTDIQFAAQGEWSRIAEGFQKGEALIAELEQRLTRFAETSELSALNRSAGTWFAASPELFQVVSLACTYYELTDGLFDPAILPALELAGYDRSMDEIRANHGASQAASKEITMPESTFAQVEIDANRQAIHLPAGMRLDLGGIAKGWIAEQAAHMISRYTSACVVNAGGDLFAYGYPEEGIWPVGVEDPFNPERDLAVLAIESGAVATSTITRRRWEQEGRMRHHLIDPRTGIPAATVWASVTAIAPHAAQAETLAKAMLIGGPNYAARLTEFNPEAAFIAVDLHSQMWASENSWRYLYGNE
jgi:thiamine biosynthesis lipoprotein